MNRKTLFVLNNMTIMKTRFQKFSNAINVIFLKCIVYAQCGFILFDLLHVKLVCMPSVCYIPNYYLQNCVYFYFVPFLLNRIGNLLAYVAALFVTSVC